MTADPLTEALAATMEAAFERALAKAARPKYAVSREEAADRLGCSTATISTLVAEGHLTYVPHTHSIPVGQLKALGHLADVPAEGSLRLVSSDALEQAATS